MFDEEALSLRLAVHSDGLIVIQAGSPAGIHS